MKIPPMLYFITILLFLLCSCNQRESNTAPKEELQKSEATTVTDTESVSTPIKEKKTYPVRALKKQIIPRFRESSMYAVLDSLDYGDTLIILDAMFEPENGNILLVSHIKDTTTRGWIYAYDSTQLQEVGVGPVQPLECIYVDNISFPLYTDNSLESYYYRFYNGDTVLIHDSMRTKDGWVYEVTNTREGAKGWYKPLGKYRNLIPNATPAIMLHSIAFDHPRFESPVVIPTFEKVVVTAKKEDSVEIHPSSISTSLWVHDSILSTHEEDFEFAKKADNIFEKPFSSWQKDILDIGKLSHLQNGLFHKRFIKKLMINEEKLHTLLLSMSWEILENHYRDANMETLFQAAVMNALKHYLGSDDIDGTLGTLSGLTSTLDRDGNRTVAGWRINPAMIHWVDSVFIPQSPSYRITKDLTAQDVYDRRFKTKLRLLFTFLQKLNKVGLLKETLAYDAKTFQEDYKFLNYLQKRYNGNDNIHMSYDEFSDVWVCGFWLRRTLDGTVDEFAGLLYKYLAIYDSEWLLLQGPKVPTNTLRLIAEQIEEIVGDEPQGEPQMSYAFDNFQKEDPLKDVFYLFWENIDQMFHEDYDEDRGVFPECAIGCFGNKVLKVIPYHRISKAFGASPFLSGPHTKDSLDLKNSNNFGYYDPDFVRWLTTDGVGALQDKRLHLLIAPYYHNVFKFSAHQFYKLYIMASSDKIGFLKHETDAYLTDAEDGSLEQDRYERYLAFMPQSEKKNHRKHLNAHALMWWMRRRKDGTDKLFFELLKKFILTYEESLPEVEL